MDSPPDVPRATVTLALHVPRPVWVAVVVLAVSASYALLHWGYRAQAVTRDERAVLEAMRQRIVMPRARLLADSLAQLDAVLDSLLGPKAK